MLSAGLTTVGAAQQQARTIEAAIRAVAPHIADLEALNCLLADEQSRRLLVDLVAYRNLGPKKVKLPLNTPAYWRKLREAEDAVVGQPSFEDSNMRFSRTHLGRLGYPIQLFYLPQGVVHQFELEQYKCTTPNGAIEAEEGDVVVDGGGFHGDSALYFALKAGDSGRVFSFEFMPENIDRWNRNVEMNPDLKPRIELMPHPLWDRSGDELFIVGSGAAAQVTSSPDQPCAGKVRTFAIDEIVESGKAERIDFIKMDIEGAEPNALKGAEKTIRKFRPKLAIAVYHKLADFWEIPHWVHGLGLGYKFYLRHFTIHSEETVLFAVAR